MKKFLLIFTLISNSAFADSSFLPSIDTITKFFEDSNKNVPKAMTEKYQFLKEKKKIKGKGTYNVSCYSDSGTPIPGMSDMQVDSIKTGVLTYDLLTIDGKFHKVPLNHCYIVEN